MCFSFQPSESSGGNTLTLIGANLISPATTAGSTLTDLSVWIGNSPCTNVLAVTDGTATDHMISCDITDYESGYYHVDVHVNNRGFASVSSILAPGPNRDPNIVASSSSPYPKLLLTSVASSISPMSGSINGGTMITISGSGFSHIFERNTVSLGGIPCTIVDSISSMIRCRTQAGSNSVALAATVNEFPVSTSLMYEYSDAATPMVTSIDSTPNDINSLSSGSEVTIVGSLLGTVSSDVQIQISSSTSMDFDPVDACIMTTFDIDTSNIATITCTVPNKPAGIYELLVYVQGYGYASLSDSTVGYALEIDSFSPMSSGSGGGVLITVSGSGFPVLSSPSDTLSVTFCDSEASSTVCVVVSSTINQLECILDPMPTDAPFTTDTNCFVTVNSGGQTQVSSDAYEFIGSLTPQINSITPSIGGTGGGTIVTIEGSGFTTQSSDPISVTIDNVECAITQNTDTSISCVTGNHTTTLQAEVKVLVQNKGNALSMGEAITYEYVDLWSSPFTWGGGPLPGEGDSVYIKVGQTVYLDVSTPELNLLLIEGSLIFQDQQDLHLQANYIFINTGKLQVATQIMQNNFFWGLRHV